MKVKIEKIIPCDCGECFESTVIFTVNEQKYSAFGDHIDCREGTEINADISHIGDTPWEERFSRNQERKQCLIKTGEWSYDGYGKIISINPVIADFGNINLDLGKFTHDNRVIGEFVYEKIIRLDIFINRS